jgi:dienelactone hydrolase
MGCSFGGATALAAARSTAQVRACVAFDPWFYCFWKEKPMTDCPTLVTMNEFFPQEIRAKNKIFKVPSPPDDYDHLAV